MGWGERFTAAAMGGRGIRVLLGVLLLVVALKTAAEILVFGAHVRCWDTMLLSGASVFALAVALALSLPRRFEQALTELRVQGALPLTVAETEVVKTDLQKSGVRMVRRAAVIVGALVLAGFLYVLVPQFVAVWHDPTQPRGVVYAVIGFFAFLTLVCAFCGFVGGAFLGRVASYGLLARKLGRPGSGLALQPGHYDGANGLAPIGALYLYQAFLIMFPILWLAAWWLLIPYYDTTQCGMGIANPYVAWRVPLLVLWITSVVFLYLAFVRPVLQLKGRIKSERSALERIRLPEIRAEIDAIRANLAGRPPSEADRALAQARLNALAREHWDIVHMPTWPMDRTTMKRYFSVNAAGTVAPIVLKGYDLASGGSLLFPELTRLLSASG
jgi:hypothetical protein